MLKYFYRPFQKVYWFIKSSCIFVLNLFIKLFNKAKKNQNEENSSQNNYDDHLSHDQVKLMMAAKTGDIKVIKELISKKIDLDIKDSNGNTALAIAIQNNHMNVVELLKDEGVDYHEIEPVISVSNQDLKDKFRKIARILSNQYRNELRSHKENRVRSTELKSILKKRGREGDDTNIDKPVKRVKFSRENRCLTRRVLVSPQEYLKGLHSMSRSLFTTPKNISLDEEDINLADKFRYKDTSLISQRSIKKRNSFSIFKLCDYSDDVGLIKFEEDLRKLVASEYEEKKELFEFNDSYLQDVFKDEPTPITIIASEDFSRLCQLITGVLNKFEKLLHIRLCFEVALKPESCEVEGDMIMFKHFCEIDILSNNEANLHAINIFRSKFSIKKLELNIHNIAEFKLFVPFDGIDLVNLIINNQQELIEFYELNSEYRSDICIDASRLHELDEQTIDATIEFYKTPQNIQVFTQFSKRHSELFNDQIVYDEEENLFLWGVHGIGITRHFGAVLFDVSPAASPSLNVSPPAKSPLV